MIRSPNSVMIQKVQMIRSLLRSWSKIPKLSGHPFWIMIWKSKWSGHHFRSWSKNLNDPVTIFSCELWAVTGLLTRSQVFLPLKIWWFHHSLLYFRNIFWFFNKKRWRLNFSNFVNEKFQGFSRRQIDHVSWKKINENFYLGVYIFIKN